MVLFTVISLSAALYFHISFDIFLLIVSYIAWDYFQNSPLQLYSDRSRTPPRFSTGISAQFHTFGPENSYRRSLLHGHSFRGRGSIPHMARRFSPAAHAIPALPIYLFSAEVCRQQRISHGRRRQEILPLPLAAG